MELEDYQAEVLNLHITAFETFAIYCCVILSEG